MRVLLIDNHDSFTYNIAHLVSAASGQEPVVVLNNAPRAPRVESFTHVIIGPGPGTPHSDADLGHSARIYREALERGIPVLGVCLGMQMMAVVHGGTVGKAPVATHGIEDSIHMDPRACSDPVFGALPAALRVVRYHSLCIQRLPSELEVLARSDDGVIQAVRHRTHRAWGVQFHPESIRTEAGIDLMTAFLRTTVEPTHSILASSHIPGPIDPAHLFRALYGTCSHAVWLDSGSDDAHSRFSYLARPERVLDHHVSGLCTGDHAPGGEPRAERETLIQRVRADLAAYRLDADGLQIAQESGGFGLGYVGYIGYGVAAETLAHHGVDMSALADPHHPDAALGFVERAIIIDHEHATARVIALVVLGDDPHAQAQRAEARAWITATSARIEQIVAMPPEPPAEQGKDDTGTRVAMLHHGRDEYERAILACQEFIEKGESYELCLTNQVRVPGRFASLEVYERLRGIARVPYGAYLRFATLALASASPERFLEVSVSGDVESRPIKGTRPRGTAPDEDHAHRESLAHSRKDRAENLMIVDLVRNDLSRVCRAGSVHVPSLFAVESFPTVHQMVSTIRGTLNPDRDALDALEATFPGGSMTGAPKLRSIALLHELEGTPRGAYSGALGWISLSGALSLSIVIRTIVIDEHEARFGIGGAITRLSNPGEEFDETVTKAGTAAAALGISIDPS